jgi:hypothetical protein
LLSLFSLLLNLLLFFRLSILPLHALYHVALSLAFLAMFRARFTWWSGSPRLPNITLGY